MMHDKYMSKVLVVVIVLATDQIMSKLFELSETDTLLLFLVIMVTAMFINQTGEE